ncbi:MAG TPA: MmgE/PrpD family protein [Acidimicrobiales bacterium]|nr:MmgE/PrpD family protein [Acidimicrobiales bacterium]
MTNNEPYVPVIHDLAEWLLDSKSSLLPDVVRKAASRQTLDSLACAFGGIEHEASEVALRVVLDQGELPECTLIGQTSRASMANAAFYNSTIVRAIDCNDIFFRNGPLGHPSDNIPVAIAIAERQKATGIDYLNAVVLGYEINWRILDYIRAHAAAHAAHWDYVSSSGIVSAAMAGLLLKLDKNQLANAMAIAGVQGFTLSGIRRGKVSMLKASAGAFAAQRGVFAALLAKEGMTGPAEFLEGNGGMLTALALDDSGDLRQRLTQSTAFWHILDVTSKPYPAIGTSQSAISAVLGMRREFEVNVASIQRIEVRLPDVPAARLQMSDPDFLSPTSRETADHSLPFLVAVALEDGCLGIEQFRGNRWMDETTRTLMGRVVQTTDPTLNIHAVKGYPTVVAIETVDGERYERKVLDAPGSPESPLTDNEITDKFLSYADPFRVVGHKKELAWRFLNLEHEQDISALIRCLGGKAPESD